jgi:hypothetical protein
MGDDGYGTIAHSAKLIGHGLTDCTGKVVDFRSVVIGTNKRTKVGTVDGPKPAFSEDLVDFIEKKMSHVDLIFQVVLLGGFSMVTDLPEVEGTVHPSSFPNDLHTRRALLSPSS